MDTQGHLDSLHHFLHSNKPLFLLLGDSPPEKKAVLAESIRGLPASERLIRLQGHTELDPSKLFTILSTNCQIDFGDRDISQRRRVDELINQLNEREWVYTVIIDDADELPLATLATVSHLCLRQEGNPIRMYWVLSGKEGLLGEMRSLQNREIPFTQLESESHVPQKATHEVSAKFRLATARGWEHYRTTFISVFLLLLVGMSLWHYKKAGAPSFSREIQRPPIVATNNTPISTPPPASTPTSESSPISLTKSPVKPIEAPRPPTKTIRTVAVAPRAKTRYALQLIASHHIYTIKTFISQHRLEKRAKILTTQYQGSPWYVVVLGQYENKQRAEQAKKALPASLQHLHPWVRRVSSRSTNPDTATTKNWRPAPTQLQTHTTR